MKKKLPITKWESLPQTTKEALLNLTRMRKTSHGDFTRDAIRILREHQNLGDEVRDYLRALEEKVASDLWRMLAPLELPMRLCRREEEQERMKKRARKVITNPPLRDRNYSPANFGVGITLSADKDGFVPLQVGMDFAAGKDETVLWRAEYERPNHAEIEKADVLISRTPVYGMGKGVIGYVNNGSERRIDNSRRWLIVQPERNEILILATDGTMCLFGTAPDRYRTFATFGEAERCILDHNARDRYVALEFDFAKMELVKRDEIERIVYK